MHYQPDCVSDILGPQPLELGHEKAKNVAVCREEPLSDQPRYQLSQ